MLCVFKHILSEWPSGSNMCRPTHFCRLGSAIWNRQGWGWSSKTAGSLRLAIHRLRSTAGRPGYVWDLGEERSYDRSANRTGGWSHSASEWAPGVKYAAAFWGNQVLLSCGIWNRLDHWVEWVHFTSHHWITWLSFDVATSVSNRTSRAGERWTRTRRTGAMHWTPLDVWVLWWFI